MSQTEVKSPTLEKMWTKDFFIISFINFVVVLIFYLLMVTIASYASKELDASTAEAGLATGIYIIGTLIGRLFSGRVINNFGSKRLLTVGAAAFMVTTLFYFIDGGIGLLFIWRLLNGMAAGIASTATGTIVAQILPASRKGEGIGYFSMSTTLGTAIGPFLAIMLGRYISTRSIFMFCVILALIAFVICFIIKVPVQINTNQSVGKQQDHSKNIPVRKGFDIRQYIEPNAIPIAIVTFFMSLGYAAILSFISFYAEEQGLVTAASFFFLAYAISVLVTRPFSGRIMDNKGSNAIMLPCFILFTVGLFILSGADTSFLLLLAAVIIGAGYGNLQSGAQAIAIKVTPSARAGLATSTFFIALDAGLGFGPYILGYIEPIIGYSQMYFLLSFVMVCCLILYMVLHGRKDKQLINYTK